MNQNQDASLSSLLDSGPKLTDDFEPSLTDQLGANVDLWLQASRQVAGFQSRLGVLTLMQRSARKKEAATYEAQTKQIAEQMAPVLEEIEVITWQIVDILAASATIRENVNNWGLFPRVLRRMLAKGLGAKGLDVSALLGKISLIDEAIT